MTLNDLREKISILYNETERNNKGDIISTSEITRCMVWAKVLPLASKINDTPPARENEINYRITIRYRNDIKPDDFIVWRGKRLTITTPPRDTESRRIWLQFDARERIRDGQT